MQYIYMMAIGNLLEILPYLCKRDESFWRGNHETFYLDAFQQRDLGFKGAGN